MTATTNPLPPKYGEFDFPRRAVVEAMHRAEQAIRNAMFEVEALGADPLLTDAGTKLIAAKDLVSDWLEGRTGLAAAAPVAAQEPLPNLMPVIHWLENGCDPKEAAKELRVYQRLYCKFPPAQGEPQGCSLCGSKGLHACAGGKMEWTPEKVEEFRSALDQYPPAPAQGEDWPTCATLGCMAPTTNDSMFCSAHRDDAPPDDAKDAARYRWLRACNSGPIGILIFDIDPDMCNVVTEEDADAAIDAAMKAGR